MALLTIILNLLTREEYKELGNIVPDIKFKNFLRPNVQKSNYQQEVFPKSYIKEFLKSDILK